eukprot:CAMPEP_0196578188 /NCGR_PEP_ID=MMETSP1081-20130531/7142_1 /TAXON_ID=36882 /ORGANISM="Pyramimonas amylifera, Strain CCMP720" /LENGTH=145 /DNA_ID=CAMNT_0041897325 /DNA_START=104 /DNA_END=541 /DNA_ORIENTATION=+
MADSAEKNFVHMDENWRQRVRYEILSQRVFKKNWGFLTDETPLDRVELNTQLVKYFNPNGGTWTVKEKKVPKRTFSKGSEEEGASDPRTALGAARTSHGSRMEAIASKNASFNPTSSNYGNRRTLEQFGIAEFGVRVTRTHLPSG